MFFRLLHCRFAFTCWLIYLSKMKQDKIDAAIALMNLSSHNRNVSLPLADVLPADFDAKRFIACDKRRIQSIVKEGKLQPINWKKVKKEIKAHLGRVMGWLVTIKMFDCNDTPKFVTFKEEEFNTDVVIFHGANFVYLAIPSSDLSSTLYKKAKEVLDIKYEITPTIRRQLISMNKCIKLSWPPHLANFGLSYHKKTFNCIKKSWSCVPN